MPSRRKVTSLKLSVFSQGSVKPRTETTVVAEVSGKIVDVSPNFIAGGFFRDGEVLLQIDPSDYEAALKRAQANLASRKAQYADQKARSEQAMKDWTNLGARAPFRFDPAQATTGRSAGQRTGCRSGTPEGATRPAENENQRAL